QNWLPQLLRHEQPVIAEMALGHNGETSISIGPQLTDFHRGGIVTEVGFEFQGEIPINGQGLQLLQLLPRLFRLNAVPAVLSGRVVTEADQALLQEPTMQHMTDDSTPVLM